jgi:acylphosphatase
MTAKRLIVRGRVQGVFYRNWTIEQARALGLTGWVRNLLSGEVEIFANGADADVAELIQRCRRGPAAALVEEVQVADAVPEPLERFEKRPSA